MSKKKPVLPKAIVLVEDSWVQNAGVNVLVDRNVLLTEAMKGQPWTAMCRAVPVSDFDLSDGWFVEIQFPVGENFLKILIPKQHVVAVLMGPGANKLTNMMGFK